MNVKTAVAMTLGSSMEFVGNARSRLKEYPRKSILMRSRGRKNFGERNGDPA